jgi:hypothetical protein
VTEGGSGLAAYAVTTSDTPPVSSSGDWKTDATDNNNGTFTITGAEIPSLGGSDSVYLHLKDNVGNLALSEISALDSLITDSTAPVFNGLAATITNGAGNTTHTAGLVEITIPFTEAYSGIKTLTFSDDVFSSVKVNNVDETSNYASGVITLTTPLTTDTLVIRGIYNGGDSGGTAVDFTFTAKDAVGNDATGIPTSISIIIDQTGPVVEGTPSAALSGGTYLSISGITITDAVSGFTFTFSNDNDNSNDTVVVTPSSVIADSSGTYTITGTIIPVSGTSEVYTLKAYDNVGSWRTWAISVSTADGSIFTAGSPTEATGGANSGIPTPVLNIAAPAARPETGNAANARGPGLVNRLARTIGTFMNTNRNTQTRNPAPETERRAVSYRSNSALFEGAGALPSAGYTYRGGNTPLAEVIRVGAPPVRARFTQVPINRNRAQRAETAPLPAENSGLDTPVHEAEAPAEPAETVLEYSLIPVPGFTAGGQPAGFPDSGTPEPSKTPEDRGRTDNSTFINPGLKPWGFTRKGKAWRRRSD